MPGTNLTRDEAAARGALIRIESYAVELDISRPGDTFSSTSEIRFHAADPGAATWVDLVAPRVHEITLNGRALDPAEVYADGRIALAPLDAENVLRVVAECAYMNTGEGLHRSIDPADQATYLYTHFEIPDARRVFASFEQPDLKAPFALTVLAPAEWTILSNSPTPEPEALPGGIARWRFDPTPPMSSYLTALLAGPYHVVRDTYRAASGQVVPLAIACRASLAEHLDPDEIFEVTRQGFDYFIEAFDQPYPFAKYDQAFVPEFNLGGMENVGLTTMTEHYLFRAKVTDAERLNRAETILHELAHMWFGDLVTMRWWDDMWLKESFATYMSFIALTDATRWRHAWTGFAITDKAWGLRQDQMPSTHPIVAEISDLEDVQLNFDGITYAKGAAVLKQLVAWVGRDAFLAGMKIYFGRYAWGVTSLADLLAVLEETSGRDLGAWSREWLQTAGPNTLRPSFEVDGEGRFTTFAVLQTAPVEHPTLRSHRIAIGLYGRDGDRLVRRHRVEVDIAGARTEVAQLVGQAREDLILLNDDDLTYASLRLDDQSLSTVVSSIGTLADPLPRALCWLAAFDMVRAAELAPRSYIDMVLTGIGSETDISVIRNLHIRLRTTLTQFVDPAHRDAATAAVATAAREAMLSAQPGGDAQLAWARLFARTAAQAAELDFVTALLQGSDVVPGLTVDTSLRWYLFAALVRAGRVGLDDIDAELAQDRTTAGEEYAAGCRAALPTAQAKEWAWQAVVERTDLANRMQDSIIGDSGSDIGVGFSQPGQLDLLEPYIGRYFSSLTRVWETRTLEIARNLVTGLYPRSFATPDVLDRTDAFLKTDPPSGLRRLLLEARDDLVRAMNAQARDRGEGAG